MYRLVRDFTDGLTVGLTETQWIGDKCPQLGAALAYFTVFSLAPLVLLLLALFGLFFGSEHARDKITEQLQLLWIYYSAQILLFGAEFTQVYANTYGSQVEPEDHAVKFRRIEVEIPV